MIRLAWIRSNPARALAFVILTAYAAVALIAVATHWNMADTGAYWGAATRLRDGQPLYIDGPADDPELYRYAPWFAVAWIPLTFLPQDLVYFAWGALTVIALAYLYSPLRSLASIALGLLLLPDLLRIASTGNAEVLMLAGLAFGGRRSSGPLWIALAASLKVFPLLFAVVYIAERQWRRATLAVALTALLWVPALAADLSAYPTGFGTTSVVWPLGSLAAVVFLLTLRRWHDRWTIAALAIAFANPRGLSLDYLMLGAGPRPNDPRAARLRSDHASPGLS